MKLIFQTMASDAFDFKDLDSQWSPSNGSRLNKILRAAFHHLPLYFEFVNLITTGRKSIQIIFLTTLKSTMWWKVSKEEAAVECLVEGCHLAGIVSRVALLDVSGYKNILQIITIIIDIVLMIYLIRGESTTTTTTRSVRSSTARSGRRTRRPRRQRAGTSILAIQQLFVKRSVDSKTLCQAYVALQEGSDNNLA